MATDEQVVVAGADGSVESVAALRWPAEHAAATGARLRAVMAWHYPTAAAPAPAGVAPAAVTDEMRAQMAQTLSKTVAERAADIDIDIDVDIDVDVDVEQEIVYGHPAQVLIDQPADADLLVVGNRGHGAFTGMLLGSVSIHCVTHAHCPVVVVRADA